MRYSHHVKHPIDLEQMHAAANLLVGTHDFTQLSNDSVERLRRNPVKTLQRFDVVQLAPDHIRFEVGRLVVAWVVTLREPSFHSPTLTHSLTLSPAC
jgi:hypothetical protein